jgi:hypothetical protein
MFCSKNQGLFRCQGLRIVNLTHWFDLRTFVLSKLPRRLLNLKRDARKNYRGGFVWY